MTKALEVDLPAEIFDVQVNIPLIHQVVVAQQAAARQGTHDTLTRGEVRGGGRKPYKQKGTGRARQGSVRAPQFAGGGTVHGPTPRSYDQRTPKKMKAAALRGALSDRARAGRVHVIEALLSGDGDKPSTKSAMATLAGLPGLDGRPRPLVVLERGDDLGWLSLRNVDTVHIVAVDQLNTYDVLLSDDVVFTKGAFDTFVGGASWGTPTTGVTAPAEEPADAAEQPAESTESTESTEWANSAKALPDGSAPEAFEIKGNTGSMKYHAPGGRWYDNTVAEVWFKTAEDAEAAGFVQAGTKAKPADKPQTSEDDS
ncbi:MAG TPA: 50S ribosomal protein L4 [Nocardioidaceae bacterium]|nr:50S ribosomal protein L4 [Nocardioidaceae bacterium]